MYLIFYNFLRLPKSVEALMHAAVGISGKGRMQLANIWKQTRACGQVPRDIQLYSWLWRVTLKYAENINSCVIFRQNTLQWFALLSFKCSEPPEEIHKKVMWQMGTDRIKVFQIYFKLKFPLHIDTTLLNTNFGLLVFFWRYYETFSNRNGCLYCSLKGT